MTSETLALGLLRYVVFLFSTVCHEAAHALVAKWGGDLTAFHGGQVTLNPVPHIRRELFGMVVVPLLTIATGSGMIGWASAPYDPRWQVRYPHRAGWMSLAGPAANFTLAIVAIVLMRIGIAAGYFIVPDYVNASTLVKAASSSGISEGIATFVSILFSLNVLLGTLNLFPVPPLDGLGAIALLMPNSLAERFVLWSFSVRAYSFIGILIVWQLFGKLYTPLFVASLRVLYLGLGVH